MVKTLVTDGRDNAVELVVMVHLGTTQVETLAVRVVV